MWWCVCADGVVEPGAADGYGEFGYGVGYGGDGDADGDVGGVSGAVSTTANAMVAEYTLTMPFAGTWNVSFGTDTTYGLTTSMVTTTGGATSVFVAGMLPNTTYHMRANVTLGDGQTTGDVDHTFASGALPIGDSGELSGDAGDRDAAAWG